MNENPSAFILFGAAAVALVAILLAAVLAGLLARRRRAIPGLQAFPLISLGLVLWALSQAPLALSTDLASSRFWMRLNILGIDLLLVAWLAFVYLYTRGLLRLTRPQWAGLLALLALSQATVTPIPAANLNLPATWLERDALVPWMAIRHSVWGWIHLTEGMLILLIGVIWLTIHLAHTPGMMRKSTRLIAIGCTVPMLVFLLESTFYPLEQGLRLTPLVFLAGEYAFLWGLRKGAHFQILPIARDLLLEKMAHGVWVLNPQGLVIDANPVAASLCGKPLQALLRQPFNNLFPELAADMDWINRGDNTHIERKHLLAGEPIWLDVRLTPLYNQDQAFSGFMVEMQDVSRRRVAEDALRESEQRYRQVIDGMIEGIVVHDASGYVLAINPSAEQILGVTREELIGRSIHDPLWRIIHPDGSTMEAEDTPARLALITGQRQSRITMGLYKLDDSLCWLLVNSEPLKKEPDGQPYAVVSTFVDITEDRLIERSLRDSEDKFRALLEFAPVAIIITDEQGMIQLMNARAEQLFGYPRAEIEGRPIEILVPGRYRKDHVLQRQEFTRQLRSREMGAAQQIIARRKDGSEVPVDVGLNLIRTNQGVLTMSYLVDITDRKQAETALQQANDQLVQSLVELEQHNRELVILSEMGDMLQISASIDEAYAIVASYAQKLFSNCSGVLFIANPTLSWFDPVTAWGELSMNEAPVTTDMCWALRRGQAYSASIANSELDCQHISNLALQGYNHSICVPMQAQGEVIGLFHLRCKTRSIPRGMGQLAATVAEHVTLSLSNLMLRDKLHSQSIRDPLTGAFNRRYLEEAFAHELHRAIRRSQSVSVIMLDVDHFKLINDTFGHSYGDRLLKALTSYLNSRLRGEDILCRYGGEEFIIILPDTDLENAIKLAEKLRQEIQAIEPELNLQKLEPIRISLGVAAFPEHGRDAEALIKAADWALYQAKQRGRDRVFAAPANT